MWVLMALMLMGFVTLYFLPTLIGINKKHNLEIFLLNLLLGWTFIGWVISLIWAISNEKNEVKTNRKEVVDGRETV